MEASIRCCLLYSQLLLTSGHKFTEVLFAKGHAKLRLKIQPGTFLVQCIDFDLSLNNAHTLLL